jgi:general secretion pathway protein D
MLNTNNAFQTSANIERQDVGVTLRVTPQISEGDTVRLDFFQEVSSVLPNQANNQFGATTSNRTVENTVFVRDGEAVVIGGIIQDQFSESATKVPFLGDLPFFGFLFRSTSELVTKTNLLVILTPRIVRDPVDLQQLSVERREEFRAAKTAGRELSGEEQKEQQKAIEAGVLQSVEQNPVERKLEDLTRRYPTESLPGLRKQRDQMEQERLQRLERKSQGSGGKFVVQVAFLKDAGAAAKLLEKLISVGYDGTVLSRNENGQTMHFVQLGPYGTQDDAERVGREIRAETGLNTLIMLEP